MWGPPEPPRLSRGRSEAEPGLRGGPSPWRNRSEVFLISIKVKRNANSVKEYFKDHLENGEYYSEKGKHDGIWHGKGLEHFGLQEGSKVEGKDFDSFAEGLNPRTGQKLTARQKEQRRSCYDMVFSAPKSLSVMALVAQDERLITAHHEALNEAFLEVEKRAQTRIRKGLSLNSDENRFTGNLVSSRFTHRSSRALDPQLHTHCVVFNVTYDPTEKKTKALQAGEIYAAAKFVTAVYRNHLASRVRSLGYDLEESRHGWRIKGVSNEIEEIFSKRSEHIQELKKSVEAKTRLKLDNNGMALLAHSSRAEKEKNITDEELLTLQKSQLTASQIKELEQLKQKSLIVEPVRQAFSFLQSYHQAKEALRFASNHIFERKSVVKKEELLEAALTKSAGQASLESLLQELKSEEFIEIGNSIMTKEEERREKEILKIIESSSETIAPLGNSTILTKPSDKQYHQQYLATKKLLDSRSRFLYLRGKAGVGKTYALKQIVKNTTLEVILAAPTSSAADTLRTEVSPRSFTVQKLLANPSEQAQLKDSLLIVDEAGLLSTKQMHSILTLAQKQNAKVLLVGDTQQHNSVEAGDALRLIENHSRIPIAEISTITRQKEEKYLEAVKA